jgi:hypothetical protein
MMIPIPARWLVAPVTAALVATALVGGRGRPQQAGPDDGGRPMAVGPTEAARGRELDARLRVILGRVGRKNELARRLIDGTATLAEVAAAFADLNRDDPVVAEMLCLRYPGLAEDERAACNAIGYVRGGNLSADRHAGVMARVREEYRCLYGREPGSRN